MKIGLSTCICPRMPLPEALERISVYGISRVEYATFNLIMSSPNAGLKSSYLESRDAWGLREIDIPVEDINETARSLGITPLQVHCPNFDLSDPDPDRRSLAVKMTARVLETCAGLEARTLVVHSLLGSNNSGDSAGRLCESLRTLARRAADLGCRIAVENGWRDLYGSRPEDLVELIEGSDPEAICACLDTGHGKRLGLSPASMARKIGIHLGATHIHDYDGTFDHLLPFSGDIDWDDLASTLSDVGYGNGLIGEIEGFPDIDDGILKSKMAMERFLGLFENS